LLKMVPVVCSFARRTIASSTTLKSSFDNTSPCLSPCGVSKGSEQYFDAELDSVALIRPRIRRISLVGKTSFAVIT
jgi:hypothetical protein